MPRETERLLDRVYKVAEEFRLVDKPCSARPHGSGHINDTFAVACGAGGSRRRYVFQRINRDIFKNIEGLMDNVARVLAHLRRTLTPVSEDPARAALTLIPTRAGSDYLQTRAGDYWRVYDFIEEADTYDVCAGPDQAYEAAKAFGVFQKSLVDLPGPRLHVTLPYFHHSPRRYAALEAAWSADTAGRAQAARAEMAFCQARKDAVGPVVAMMEQGAVPERITHNDTKLNNVMIDNRTGRAVCVIDLDTVMPGTALCDFGDMIRTFTPTAAEDERDLTQVHLNMEIFRGLAEGYGEVARDFLTETEKAWLVFAGRLITFTIGVRFLTDYLAGDVYFKVHRPGHNLDRARTQFKMVEQIEQRQAEMEALVKRVMR